MKEKTKQILSQKDEITQRIYTIWEETSQENRNFSQENIEKCNADLDIFIQKMEVFKQNNVPQEDYAKAIYEICKNLSTFGQEDEEPEFLHGFLYDIYTEDLTNFIRETAFAYGFELPPTEVINTNVFSLRHSSEFRYEYFSVYIGADEENGISLLYDSDRHCFEYDENPYGECCPLPIYNFRFDGSISFEVLSQGRYRNIKLVAQCPQDSVWLKTLAFLHQNEVFPTFPDKAPIDFCNINLESQQGMLCRLDTTNKDSNGNIISMFNKGSGITIFTSEVNEKGDLQSEYQTDKQQMIDKKLFFIHAVPIWKRFEIDSITFEDDLLVINTKNSYHKYNQNNELEKKGSKPRTFTYEIKTFPFMLTFLKEVIQLNKIFSLKKSKK